MHVMVVHFEDHAMGLGPKSDSLVLSIAPDTMPNSIVICEDDNEIIRRRNW